MVFGPWSMLARRHKLSSLRQGARSFCRKETQGEEGMGAGAKFAAAFVLGILTSLPLAAAQAAELTVITNQGTTPEVREVAAAFERASGNKVTVLQDGP